METAVVARGVNYLRADIGYGTNNDAEWLALIHAAEVALLINVREVSFLGDSAYVIGQASGATKCRGDHFQIFHTLKSQFQRISIRRINRHQNLAGIALARSRWN